MTTTELLQVAAVVVPSLTALVLAVANARASRRARAAESEAERLRLAEERSAQKRYDLYHPLLQAFGDMLTPSRSARALASLEDIYADFQSFVTIWGSDEVVRKFFRFRTASGSNPPPPILFRMIGDFLVEVRRDLAWPSTEITGLDILGMRLNDLPENPQIIEAFSSSFDELCEKYSWEPPWPKGY